MKILCLIIDAVPHAEWQATYDVHRHVWNKCLDVCSGVNGYFLRSDPGLATSHVVDGRTFTIRGEERRDTILRKTLQAVEVLLADHDYVVRTNLSSIYDFRLLRHQALPKKKLYSGHVWHDRGWNFVTGSGMLLSRDVAKRLLNPVSAALEPYDDVAIWQILNAQGIAPQHREALIYDYGKGLDQLRVGKHVHYRLRDENDPLRAREREVTEAVFNLIYKGA